MNEEDKEMYVSMFERVYTARGEEKERAKIARNMLNKGLSAKEILEYTGMPQEELTTMMNGETPAF
jgi:SOS response regulatory protein OraA/RecX